MSEVIPYRIITPDGVVAEDSAAMVLIPGVDGDMGVMLRHSAMIVQLQRGSIAVFDEGQKVSTRYYVDGGTAHITPEALLILSHTAMDVATLDVTALSNSLQSAAMGSEDAVRAEAQLSAVQSPVYV